MASPKKAAESDFFITGIPGLDALLENGIPRNSTVLLAGSPGTGKTILALQVVHNACKKGKKCVYVSFDENEHSLEKYARSFGWDFDEFQRKKLLVIKYVDVQHLEGLVSASGRITQGLDVRKALHHVISAAFIPDLVIIDSLSILMDIFFGSGKGRWLYAHKLFRSLEELNATALLISEKMPLPEAPEVADIEEFLADGIIALYYLRTGSYRERAIEVLKMKGCNHQEKLVAMRIEKGKGIYVAPDVEVFQHR
ncbi:MAG: AAA family ATPase [Candidatus Aenigmarchaeota archaeon]|nr:AAA family ATPase [Candidatus Aenigmarchaeota archaeon]